MRTNRSVAHTAQTHEGGRANAHQKPLEELTRAVSTCLLFENTFYEKGSDLATRIAELCTKVSAADLGALAMTARRDMKLRHIPLYLTVQLLKKKPGALAAHVIDTVVRRPNEMGELIALYRKEKRIPLAAQLKKGLAAKFPQFNAYQLAKWNGDAAIKLKDVMFMVHPKPESDEQAALWKQLIAGTLPAADTWEAALSAGNDKRDTWERLITGGNLGYMALLMNLRNMHDVGVPQLLIENALRAGAKGSHALPFRFISAYKHAPYYAQALSEAMELAVEGNLAGKTALVLDVSGSMNGVISGKSLLTRVEAAAALAVLMRGITPECRIFVYSTDCKEVPNLKGMALLEAIKSSLGGSTETKRALRHVERNYPGVERVILLTDEQSSDGIHPLWCKHGYIINVASYKPSLETGGAWHRINGWSERIIDWIQQEERDAAAGQQ